MPTFHRSLDIYQGYNYKKDKQTSVGYVTKIKIGDVELAADQTCKDPMNPTTDLKVVAVLSDALWETGVTDALYLTGQISVPNRQGVALMVISDLTKVEVIMQFTVYEYDLGAKKYFKSFHANDTDLKGLVEKRGSDLNVSVAEEASEEIQSPPNFSFSIGIKPQPEAQALHIATSDTNKITKSWGLKLG